MELVRDLMSAPAVFVAPDARLADVSALFTSRKISAVPVVSGGDLVGIVSTTDVLRATAVLAQGDDSLSVRDVMKSPVVTVGSRESVEDAARKMSGAFVHRLIVVDGAKVVGVLAARDLLDVVRAKRIQGPISDHMSGDVTSVDVGDSIDQATRVLAECGRHGVVVTEDDGPVGVFTHAEALAAAKLPPLLRERPVEEVMSYETLFFDVATPVYRAARYVLAMNARRLLVTRNKKLVGVLSVVDLVRTLTLT